MLMPPWCIIRYERADLFCRKPTPGEPLHLHWICPVSGSVCSLWSMLRWKHADLDAVNDKDNPENVVPKQVKQAKSDGSEVSVAPLTWNLLRFSC